MSKNTTAAVQATPRRGLQNVRTLVSCALLAVSFLIMFIRE